ncbi:hypothetical protein HanHA300_Chr08g0285001 [Helianthus annuus]|nr:hypothetical protein HanHA300_Chr08g0285001 [Helianthus annuus]
MIYGQRFLAEELKPKKFFVQHVDTVSSSDVAVDILQSFVASKPDSADPLNSKAKVEDQRRSNKTDNVRSVFALYLTYCIL